MYRGQTSKYSIKFKKKFGEKQAPTILSNVEAK